jgi:sugar/nucleoside kinase (ribokinase family)
LPAIQAADVIDTVAAGDGFRPGVVADQFHISEVIHYSMRARRRVKAIR